ncbi:MAG: hypothetical protein IH604_01605 [Burkholderiales bacterium]|nr:hypothetical protein [Burkholderiales bacterium]
MADRMMLVPSIAAGAALLLSTGSAAQALTDPTKPPVELIRSAAGAAAGQAAGAAPRSRLQSILLSSLRKGAIISGQYVPLGGTYGKATLVDITATGVTLKTGQELDVLQLFPSMEKPAATSGVTENPEKMAKSP